MLHATRLASSLAWDDIAHESRDENFYGKFLDRRQKHLQAITAAIEPKE